MMMDIFSNFDPSWFNLCYKNFTIMVLAPIMVSSAFWLKQNSIITTLTPIISYISNQLMTTKSIHIKMTMLMTSMMFMLIMFMNILGMVPYLLSITSHILFTISMSLPMWSLLMLSSCANSMKKFMAHLLPNSAPMWLSPFLVLIELISITVRPFTLSFRLAANMTAGHVIMALIFMFSISIKMKTLLLMSLMSSMYLMFELMICMVQAYIFCLLLSLYADDHS